MAVRAHIWSDVHRGLPLLQATRGNDAGWIGAGLLYIILRRRGWLRLDGAGRHRLPLIALATVIMAAAVACTSYLSGTTAHTSSIKLILLIALVMLGLAIYLVSLQLLGVAKVKDLVAAVRQRT